jgi:hypothetical protein
VQLEREPAALLLFGGDQAVGEDRPLALGRATLVMTPFAANR